MARFTPTTLLSTYNAITALNANFTSIAALFEQCLMRDGSTTNSMNANIDMNNYLIQNLADAVDDSDAVNYGQMVAYVGTISDPDDATFTIGTVANLPPGSSPSVTVSGTYPDFTLDFELVRGETGSGSSVVWGDISGTLSNQTDLNTALAAKSPLASPTFTGTPAAPTAAPATSTTQIATTEFVTSAIAALAFAPLADPTFTGTPDAPTAAEGTATTQLATTEFVDRLRDISQNSQTAAYELVLGDRGKHVSITTGGITIPANASVAFPTGTVITIFNNSASTQGIAITTDTLRLAGTSNTGTRTIAAYGLATLLKVASTTWVVSGNVT